MKKINSNKRYYRVVLTGGLLLAGLPLFVPNCQKKPTPKYDIKTQAVEYTSGGKAMEGYLAMPKAAAKSDKKWPAVLVVHEWTGLGDYAKKRADMLAKLGYIAFAMDMYGKGVFATNHKEAAKLSGAYFKDRELMRQRMKDALKTLTGYSTVNADKLAAIGYCFGGGAVLELALSGADLKAIASFHGFPNSPNQKDAGKIKGRVQIHHGGADSMVKMETVNKFKSDLDAAKIPVEVFVYEGAPHAFTRFTDEKVYKPKADETSWKRMLKLFSETLN